MNRRAGWRIVRWGVAVMLLAALVYGAYEVSEAPGSQVFGKTIVSGPADQKVVALTFDDGPNPPYTDRILDVLAKENVHATFFLVGRAVEAYPKVALRELRDGNALGNHAWEHEHLIMLTRTQLRASLQRTDDAIFKATGTHTHLMRPPFGSRDWVVLGVAGTMGYTPVMWSVPLVGDWEYPTANVIAQRVLANVHDGSIVVLHDGNRGQLCAAQHLPAHVCDRSSDIDATRIIVETLKARGYRFVTVPQLMSLRAMRSPAPGAE
jgi:peptidoglycan/xylan/chitin deacetylase (PgdA/CDA1 family)